MKVIVKTQIHGSFASASTEDKYAYKEFDLPFPPFVGLGIEHKTKKGETDVIEIDEVTWIYDTQSFECYQKSDKEIYDAILHKTTPRPMAEIVDEYIEAGWLFDPID